MDRDTAKLDYFGGSFLSILRPKCKMFFFFCGGGGGAVISNMFWGISDIPDIFGMPDIPVIAFFFFFFWGGGREGVNRICWVKAYIYRN